MRDKDAFLLSSIALLRGLSLKSNPKHCTYNKELYFGRDKSDLCSLRWRFDINFKNSKHRTKNKFKILKNWTLSICLDYSVKSEVWLNIVNLNLVKSRFNVMTWF